MSITFFPQINQHVQISSNHNSDTNVTSFGISEVHSDFKKPERSIPLVAPDGQPMAEGVGGGGGGGSGHMARAASSNLEVSNVLQEWLNEGE